MGPVLSLALSFSYLKRFLFTDVSNYVIIVVNEIHSVHCRAPQDPKDKIVSKYKRNKLLYCIDKILYYEIVAFCCDNQCSFYRILRVKGTWRDC